MKHVIACATTALGMMLFPASLLAEDGPFIPLTHLLPPLVPADPAEDRTPECGADGLACIIWVEQQLAAWESFFGCDHRAVFPTVYRTLTHEARLYLERDAAFFDDPAGLGHEAVRFYDFFNEMMTAHLNGEELPPAWQVAMDAANDGDWTGLHDMILAISAHVQRDMPFVVAEIGVNLPDGSSRKPDHDRFNQILNDAYDSVIQAVGERYDPLALNLDTTGGLIDNIASQQLVALWREGVWRNAELITGSRDTALYDTTVLSIETVALLSGLAVRNGPIPGYRATRDAYCAEQQASREAAAASTEEREEEELQPGLTVVIRKSGGCALGQGDNGMGWLLLLLSLLWLLRRRASAS